MGSWPEEPPYAGLGPPLIVLLALIYWPLAAARQGHIRRDVPVDNPEMKGVTRRMTPTPSWLYYLFAVAILTVAVYSVVLLVMSFATRRSAGWDVDIAHILMGVSMAGMFIA